MAPIRRVSIGYVAYFPAVSIQGLFATSAAASLFAALVVAVAVDRAAGPTRSLAAAARAAADPTEAIP